MKTNLPIEIKRFKQIREEQYMTQVEFAEKINVKNSTADIERGKTKLSGKVVMELLQQFNINPLWLYGKSFNKTLELNAVNVMPKVIVLDKEENENMLMVNQKAAAGYPHNINDTSWYEQLPAFDMPIPQFRNATYRGFQIEGDSMLPDFRPDDWVLAKAVDNLAEAPQYKVYVFVLQDSVLVKKLQKTSNPSIVRLISSNTAYPPYQIHISEIQEMWEVKSKLTFSVNENSENSMLKKLEQSMQELKQELASMKRD
ncbi:MAG: LexA family transcriptional regulator [Bacteroidota bacterium]